MLKMRELVDIFSGYRSVRLVVSENPAINLPTTKAEDQMPQLIISDVPMIHGCVRAFKVFLPCRSERAELLIRGDPQFDLKCKLPVRK